MTKKQDVKPGDPPVKRGRPRKTEVDQYKRGTIGKGKRGRPPGMVAKIEEMKARLLANPKSEKVLDSIFNAALTDGHPNQAAAWKLWIDRALPVSYFAKEGDKETKPQVTINISGIHDTPTIDHNPVDYIEVDDDKDYEQHS